jgi:hypothetical protein
MNDFLARELIDVLKHMAGSQRVIEMHLSAIRFDMNDLASRESLTDFEEHTKVWENEVDRQNCDRERVKDYNDTK